MARISLSKLFKMQIRDQRLTKIDVVRITSTFKRVERMIDNMDSHGFVIEQLVIKIRVIDGVIVIFTASPPKDKIIVKKLLFK